MFVLAERLGMPVSDLVDRVDAPEIAEWMAHFRLQQEPDAFVSARDIDDQIKRAFKSKMVH